MAKDKQVVVKMMLPHVTDNDHLSWLDNDQPAAVSGFSTYFSILIPNLFPLGYVITYTFVKKFNSCAICHDGFPDNHV